MVEQKNSPEIVQPSAARAFVMLCPVQKHNVAVPFS